MSNQERDPGEVLCTAHPGGAGVQVMEPRDVPLGGIRAMNVRRTLPSRERTLIGAWCFADHYGPDPVASSGGMVVTPHPHTGLATVSWLFEGEIVHRDSAGNHAMVLPGELNLMTAGRGISHSENSVAKPAGSEATDATPAAQVLHGAQLWVALPDHARDVEPAFAHHAPKLLSGEGWSAKVFLGSLLGDTSPVQTHTPLLGAEIRLQAGATLVLDVDPTFELGVLVDAGPVTFEGTELRPAELGYLAPGCDKVTLTAYGEARVLVLGGPPFGESLVMWWNFVGRTHEEIAQYRAEWQAQIAPDGALVNDGQDVRPGRFGIVLDDHDTPIPAPPLPNLRLKPRV